VRYVCVPGMVCGRAPLLWLCKCPDLNVIEANQKCDACPCLTLLSPVACPAHQAYGMVCPSPCPLRRTLTCIWLGLGMAPRAFEEFALRLPPYCKVPAARRCAYRRKTLACAYTVRSKRRQNVFISQCCSWPSRVRRVMRMQMLRYVVTSARTQERIPPVPNVVGARAVCCRASVPAQECRVYAYVYRAHRNDTR